MNDSKIGCVRAVSCCCFVVVQCFFFGFEVCTFVSFVVGYEFLAAAVAAVATAIPFIIELNGFSVFDLASSGHSGFVVVKCSR